VPKIPKVDPRWVLEEEDSKRLAGQHPSLWADPQKSCITCLFHKRPESGRTFRWWNESRTEVVDWECDCTSQWLLHRYLLHHGIGKSYQRLGWLDAQDVPQDTLDATIQYLDNAALYVERGLNMIFHSPDAGTGKTLMLMLMAKGLLARGEDVYVAQMNSIVQMHTTGWRSPEDQQHFERRIMNCAVLGIDDLGKETGQNRVDFIDRLLDRVIRHRTAHALPTITTTNLTPEQVESGYNRYVMSLLTETCTFVETSGLDWRPKARKRHTEEIEQGLIRPLMLG
jgi:DNA replication protein DnaC